MARPAQIVGDLAGPAGVVLTVFSDAVVRAATRGLLADLKQ
ncbi:hypothetical protein [Streptomyces sp. NPDC059072]